VQSHLTKGESPTFGPVTARVVEYGIARLRNTHSGEITEPLAFLSLMKWLEHRPSDSIMASLRMRLGTEASRGDAYEELAILYLLRALRYPVPLSSVFQFHGTAPLWADKASYIVARLDGSSVPVDILGAPQNPSLGGVDYADRIEDILNWLETPPAGTRSAILVPGPLFGPDVLALFGDILLMGQLKSYLTGNVASLSATTLTEALTSLHPNHWFPREVRRAVSSLSSTHTLWQPSHKRHKLINAINKRHVLRFVGGYPLPPLLDSKAGSVQAAIAALGQNVALASFKLDAFRACFITEDEARNLLTPMEHALDVKRKRKREQK
jgi:hypothetical protein